MSGRSDRYLCSAKTLEEAEDIRSKLMNMSPRPCVFVITDAGKSGYDIHIAAEHGSYPSDDFFSKIEEELLSIEIELDENGNEKTPDIMVN